MTDVTAFYAGAVSRAKNPSKLEDAVKWLDKAVAFEVSGDENKANMAFRAARKAEAEALGYAVE